MGPEANQASDAYPRGGGRVHNPSRELTVGEYIQRQMDELEIKISALRRLKDNLPKAYLDHPCSVISTLLRSAHI